MKRSHEATASGQAQKARPNLSQDGYLRISLSELSSLTLRHLLSGLDDDATEHTLNGVNQTAISGYTEWLSQGTPTVTIGWDWRLDLTNNVPSYVRDGWPRTNLMLVDTVTHQDLGDEVTAARLARLIDQSEWTCETIKHIESRYA